MELSITECTSGAVAPFLTMTYDDMEAKIRKGEEMPDVDEIVAMAPVLSWAMHATGLNSATFFGYASYEGQILNTRAENCCGVFPNETVARKTIEKNLRSFETRIKKNMEQEKKAEEKKNAKSDPAELPAGLQP